MVRQYGLELYRYEFAGLLMHAEHLEAVHGVGPHTISVPRIKHADDIDPSAFDNGISDEIGFLEQNICADACFFELAVIFNRCCGNIYIYTSYSTVFMLY